MLVIGHRANNVIKLRNYIVHGVDAVELDLTSSGVGHGPDSIKPATLKEAILRRVLTEPTSSAESMIREIVENHIHVIIDIKTPVGYEPFFNAFLGKGQGVMVSSKFHPVIRSLKEKGFRIPMLASIQERPVSPSSVMEAALADGLSVELSYVDEDLVNEVHEANGLVFVWTVNDVDQALHLQTLGVDAIITDRPDLIVPAVKGGVEDRSLARELYRWLTS